MAEFVAGPGGIGGALAPAQGGAVFVAGPSQQAGRPDFSLFVGDPRLRAYLERREQTLAARYSRIDALLDSNFLPGGLDDLGLRFDMARSNELSEKQAKFRAKYPRGQLNVLPIGDGQTTLIFRRAPDEPWREVDPPGAQRGNLADIAGAVLSEPVVGAATAGVAASPAGPLAAIVGAGLGAIAGGVAKYGVESLRGFEDTEWTQAMRSMGLDATVEMAAGGLGAGGLTAFRLIRGLPTARLTADAGEIARAAERLDLPPPVVGQLAQSPVTRGQFFQTGTTSPRPGAILSEQEQALLTRFRTEAGDMSMAGLSDENLDAIVALQQRDLGRLYQFSATNLPNAGEALQRGVSAWELSSKEVIDRAYARVRELSTETVFFDVSNIQDIAKSIRRGTRIGTKPRPAWPGGPLEQQPPIRAEGAIQGDLASLLTDIAKIDPVVRWRPNDSTAFDQVRALRTRLHNLISSEEGDVRGPAKLLYGALSDALRTPMGVDSPEFLSSYLRANALNAQRESILEMNFIVTALRENASPDDIAARFFRPGNAEKLTLLQTIMPPGDFAIFQDGFKSSLFTKGVTSGGNAIVRELDTFAKDPESLRLLMSPQDEQAIRQYATLLARFDEGAVRSVINRDFSLAERALRMGDAKVDDLRRTVAMTGGPDSQFAESVRAGVYKRILDAATETDLETRAVTISPEKLVRAIDDARKNEAYGIVLRESDLTRLEDYRKYAATVGGAGDVGGPMQAGEVRAGVAAITRPHKFVGAWHTIANNAIVARLLSRPVTANMLPEALALDAASVAAWTTALATAAQELQANVNRPLVMPR